MTTPPEDGTEAGDDDDLVRVLGDLAVLARRPRALILDVTSRQGDWTPSSGSLAEAELRQTLFADANDNKFLVNHPRSVASLHLRIGADYLAGIASLVLTGELFFAPLALARTAFEHAVRAVILLDPRVAQRERCARALLEDIVSAYYERLAWKHLVGASDPAYQTKNALFKKLRKCAERCFTNVSFSDGEFTWTVSGEVYMRPTTAVGVWSELMKRPVQGEGLYDVLSLYVHPQSYPSRPEAVFDPSGETALKADPDLLRMLTVWVIACWVDAAGLLYAHQGWNVPELADIHREAEALSP